MWYKTKNGDRIENLYKHSKIEYAQGYSSSTYVVNADGRILEAFKDEAMAKKFLDYIFHEFSMRRNNGISYDTFQEWLKETQFLMSLPDEE